MSVPFRRIVSSMLTAKGWLQGRGLGSLCKCTRQAARAQEEEVDRLTKLLAAVGATPGRTEQ